MSDQVKYQLKLSLEDVNLILKALGQLPFSEVYATIHEIHQQVQAQVADDAVDQ